MGWFGGAQQGAGHTSPPPQLSMAPPSSPDPFDPRQGELPLSPTPHHHHSAPPSSSSSLAFDPPLIHFAESATASPQQHHQAARTGKTETVDDLLS
jgi:hypothetical protein